MFAYKKKYFLIIENTKDIDLRNIKKRDKFVIIYRNIVSEDNILKLKRVGLFVFNSLVVNL